MSKTMASSKGGRNSKKRELTPQENVTAAFMGCARCSFLLAGYRLIFDDFDQAVENSQGSYLDLSWNQAVRDLVQSTYGSRIERDAYHYQGSCPECRRTLVFEAGETADDPATFRIAIKNR